MRGTLVVIGLNKVAGYVAVPTKLRVTLQFLQLVLTKKRLDKNEFLKRKT